MADYATQTGLNGQKVSQRAAKARRLPRANLSVATPPAAPLHKSHAERTEWVKKKKKIGSEKNAAYFKAQAET